MPRCCSDDEYPWEREGDPLDSKYLYVCHAEFNAILNCERGNVRGCTVYVTLFPCNECAKAIIQSGIKEVVYREDKYSNSDSVIAAKRMFDSAGVKYRQYDCTNKEKTLKF
jgi:dCMP deaminase